MCHIETLSEEDDPRSSPFSFLLTQNIEPMVESVSVYFVVRLRTSGFKVQKRGPTIKIQVEPSLPLGDGTALFVSRPS